MRYVSLCNIFLLLLFVLFSRSSPVYQPQKPLDPIADVPDRFKMAPLSPEAMKALPPVRKPPTTHIPIPPTKKPLSVLSRPRRRPGPEPPNTFATQKWEGRLGVMDAKNQARLRSSSDPTPPGSSPWVSGHRHSNSAPPDLNGMKESGRDKPSMPSHPEPPSNAKLATHLLNPRPAPKPPVEAKSNKIPAYEPFLNPRPAPKPPVKAKSDEIPAHEPYLNPRPAPKPSRMDRLKAKVKGLPGGIKRRLIPNQFNTKSKP